MAYGPHLQAWHAMCHPCVHVRKLSFWMGRELPRRSFRAQDVMIMGWWWWLINRLPQPSPFQNYRFHSRAYRRETNGWSWLDDLGTRRFVGTRWSSLGEWGTFYTSMYTVVKVDGAKLPILVANSQGTMIKQQLLSCAIYFPGVFFDFDDEW